MMSPKLTRRLAAIFTPALAVCLAAGAGATAPQPPGSLSFSQPAYQVNENGGSAVVTLTRTGGADGELTARVDTADVTTNADDYLFSPGSLDATFAQPTGVTSIFEKQQIALQPDGKVLVASPHFVDRRNADGTDDPSFNTVTFNNTPNAVAPLPDGKILVAGNFSTFNNTTQVGHMVRLNPDGTLDTTFNAGTGPNETVRAIVVQPDGKILIAGIFSSVNGTPRSGLARLNADGSLDTSHVAQAGSFINALVRQPDGKAIIGGSIFEGGGVKRLNEDGSLDTSFQRTPGNPVVFALALQPDGKVVVGGFFTQFDGQPIPHLVRLNADGTLDTGFNSNLGAGPDSAINAVALQPDGRIVVGGSFKLFNNIPATNIARLNPDGGFDPTFNSRIMSSPGDRVASIVPQPDGGLLIAGFFSLRSPTALRQHVARMYGDKFVRWGDGDAADKTLTLPVFDDTLDEQNETLNLSLTPLGGVATTGANPTATLTIVDNDDAPSITSAPPPGGVTRTPYSHTFVATGSPAPTFSVTPGTLPPGLFLNPTTGVLSGTPTTAGTFNNITVTASNGVAPAATQTFGITILSGGSIRFSAGAFSAGEGGGTATITVTRTGGSAGTTSVDFSAGGGTATGGGADYTLAGGTLVFADGETSKTFGVQLTNDAVNERDETANLFLSNVTGSGTLGTPSSAVLTITNDDPLPTIAIGDVVVTEDDAGFKNVALTVTRTGLIDRAVSFTATTADGTATANEDYIPLSAPFQISSFTQTTTVNVAVLGDTITEPDESFVVNLTSPTNATITDAQGVCEVKNNETPNAPPTVQFARFTFHANEGDGAFAVNVTRSGDISAPATVSYATQPPGIPNAASERADYTTALGRLSFAAGEASKTFHVLLTDDAHVEFDEFIQLVLSSPTGGTALGSPVVAIIRVVDNDAAPSAVNPIDATSFFVRQHYRDFLGRDPDAGGLEFWSNEIEMCGADLQCREVKKINVSAAFFLAIEFQETGYLVYRLHKSAFNSGERLPFRTFLGDTQEIGKGVIVGEQGWEQTLEQNKRAFLDAFVQRAAFTTQFPLSMTPAQFVDALNANTGDPLNPSAGGSLTQAERDQLVADLTNGTKTRAEVLRAVAENAEFRRRHFNKAFVLMQYFGYLRRAPNSAPDVNFNGYIFWLNKLEQFNGNFVQAEMVKAFLSSIEYRQRFGQ